MTPRSPLPDIQRGSHADTKAFGYGAESHLGMVENEEGSIVGENGETVFLASGCSASRISVSDVVGLSAEFEMIEIDAASVVASVADNATLWDASPVPNPDERRDVPRLFSYPQLRVFVGIEMARPFNTPGGFRDFLVFNAFKNSSAHRPVVSDASEFGFMDVPFAHVPMIMPDIAGLLKCETTPSHRR